MKKIAIVKLSALGDIVHAMVALQFIKKKLIGLLNRVLLKC
jgi:heptosyltransferase-1